MDIILTTTIYPPDVGGPATYAPQIKKRLEERGYHIKIVTTSTAAYNDPGVTKTGKKPDIRILGFFIFYYQSFLFLLRFSKDSDIIYTLDPKFLGFISILAGYLLRKPTILRFSGDRVWEIAFNKGLTSSGPSVYFKNISGSLYLKFLFIFQKLVLNMPKKIIVPSKDMEKLAVDYYKIRSEKISVIYNSIELEPEKKVKLKEKQQINILFVGRLIKLDRCEMVILLIRDIHMKYPQVTLEVAGDGPELQNLKKISEELGTSQIITFLGNVDRSNLAGVYQKADILIHNRVYDVFPHVLIEAMKYKVPIVTSSEGGAREIVQNNETGLIASSGSIEELKEKLELLIIDSDLRKKISENAYEHLKNNFTWKKNLVKLEKELNDLI